MMLAFIRSQLNSTIHGKCWTTMLDRCPPSSKHQMRKCFGRMVLDSLCRVQDDSRTNALKLFQTLHCPTILLIDYVLFFHLIPHPSAYILYPTKSIVSLFPPSHTSYSHNNMHLYIFFYHQQISVATFDAITQTYQHIT